MDLKKKLHYRNNMVLVSPIQHLFLISLGLLAFVGEMPGANAGLIETMDDENEKGCQFRTCFRNLEVENAPSKIVSQEDTEANAGSIESIDDENEKGCGFRTCFRELEVENEPSKIVSQKDTEANAGSIETM